MKLKLKVKKEDLQKKLEIPVLDSGEEIVEKINDLPTDDNDLKIDAKHIKNLPKSETRNMGGGLSRGVADSLYAPIGSSGSGHTIQEEGSPLTARSNLNFIGAAVTATDNAGTDATDVTVDAVPYTGATQDVDLGGTVGITNASQVTTDTLEMFNGGEIGFFTDALGTQSGALTNTGDSLYTFGGFSAGASTLNGTLDFSGLTTSDKTFTFPNQSGTIQLEIVISDTAPANPYPNQLWIDTTGI